MAARRRLEIAARALLNECARRASSSHPHAYTIPWGRAIELQAALDEVAADRRRRRPRPLPFPLHFLAKWERRG